MSQNRDELNKNLVQMLNGSAIIDVTTSEQAKIVRCHSTGTYSCRYLCGWRYFTHEQF